MTLHLHLTPFVMMRAWRLPSYTPDLDLIVARLRDVYWRVEVVDE